MKKVLILAYDFPPYVSVGALRPHSWYKYFHEFGIYPVIVTRQWGNKHKNHLDYIAESETDTVVEEVGEHGTILRAPYKPNLANRLLLKYGDSRYSLLRKSISAYYEIIQYLTLKGPKACIHRAANSYLKNNKVDCIIATAEPYVLFKYAKALGKKHNTPWIADYRDPWSQNINVYKNIVLKVYYESVEKNITSKASAIVTVSDFFEKKIRTLLPNNQYYILPNGYDPEAIEKAKDVKQNSNVFSIGFVGTILEWHPIHAFLKTIAEFIDQNPDKPIQVNFYGINTEDNINSIIAEYPNLSKAILIYPKLSNDKLIAEIAKNNVMALFNYYSYMGTKIYDYIGIKRQILLCFTDDDEANKLKDKFYNLKEDVPNAPQLQSELLTETQSGIIIKNKEHLKSVIKDLYVVYKEKGFVPCNSVNTEQFSRKIQTEKLAGIINTLHTKQ